MKRKKEDCKKAQAAMEFLMSYGWAVLVTLIAIGALAYFGVLSVNRFLPESCTLMPGLACEDFIVSPEGMILFVRAGMGVSLKEVTITILGSEDDKCLGDFASISNLADGSLGRFNIYCVDSPVEGTRFVSDLLIRYRSNGLSHTKKGKIIALVQGLSQEGLDEGICENADPDFCDGLDIVFGEGYKDSCCDEFPPLCC